MLLITFFYKQTEFHVQLGKNPNFPSSKMTGMFLFFVFWSHKVCSELGFFFSPPDGGTVSSGRKVRVESGYFSLEKTKSEPSPQSAHHSQPPQHLPLSSSASSSSLGAPSSRYNSESEPQTSPHQPSQDPLPSPGSLVSPSYSTISSSQSSLDSDPSGATSTWEGHNGGGGGRVGCSGREYAALADVPRARRLSYREAFRSEKKRQDLRARTRSPGREEVARLFGEERR